MEWLNTNSGALGLAFVFMGAIIGWFTRLEVRLSRSATKDEMGSALGKIYDLLRPMGEDIARIKGYCATTHDHSGEKRFGD